MDGVDTRQMSRGDLRTGFGMVLQDTWIKDGTDFCNICMGKSNATREEVIKAGEVDTCA